MNFALLPTLAVLLGIAALAIGLWIAQRLRVQYREVEVISTLFWQAALEETRARVFARRFRHWLAWMLLVAVASILWILLAQPSARPLDGRQHVVLLDWSVDDPDRRAGDLQLAIRRAESLPAAAREIVAVGEHVETLLAAGEPVELAALRAADQDQPSPAGIGWAIETLSFRASSDHPLALHVVGDADVEKKYLDRLNADVTIYRIARGPTPPAIQMKTLGVADSQSGRWNTVDVSIGFAAEQAIEPSRVQVTIDDQPIDRQLQPISDSEFHLDDLAARGGILRVQVDGETIGSITLPSRESIRVMVDGDVPETLRELIRLDNACQIVESDADVRVGTGADANLRLSGEQESAFLIESDHDDPAAALDELIDELALQQIDATALAEQSGQIIDVQVAAADRRTIAIWSSLFTPAFDFSESRACPILVARSIRWLANRPPLVPWAQQGERLPVAAPRFQRAFGTIARTDDGRQIHTVRLATPVTQAAELPESPTANLFARVGLSTWLGLIVSMLLATEWVLYQRGRLP